MLKHFRSIIILLLASVSIYAQDSTTVIDKLFINSSPLTVFEAADYNPSAMAFTWQKGLSDIRIGYERKGGKAGLEQMGTAFNDFFFNAQSYIQKKNHHIWGSASYTNKRTDHIKWNESSDYLTVYPYVIADSVGGNNLKTEKYSFTGGYAQSLQHFSWGIQLHYWAQMEYRSKDPRPNNNTSNLLLSVGLHYKLKDAYAIGGGISFRKYKQKNHLSFYNVLGRPYIYHMTGLGNDAYYFANDVSGSLFDGNGYGANIQLIPTRKKGLSATFAYDNFSFEKQLLNSQNLTLSSLDENKMATNIGYLLLLNNHSLNFKATASYTERKGTEGKFTRDNAGINLVKISSEQQYIGKHSQAAIEVTYQHNTEKLFWYISPTVSFKNIEESHKSSERSMKVSQMSFAVKPGFSIYLNKHLLSMDGLAGYAKRLNTSLDLSGLPSERSITQTILNNYSFLSANGIFSQLSARFNYQVPGINMMAYVQARGSYSKHSKTDAHLIEVSLGVVF